LTTNSYEFVKNVQRFADIQIVKENNSNASNIINAARNGTACLMLLRQVYNTDRLTDCQW